MGTFDEYELYYRMDKLCSIGDFQISFLNIDRKQELHQTQVIAGF